MCGLTALYAYHPAAPPLDSAELLRIRDQMQPRGPDGAGEWHSPDRRVALAHRRLSIIDLSERGAQPMASSDGRLLISFNGEIYNHRALRTELEAQGRRFHSDSDTEVLLHLYATCGQEMVHKLRGMFAFALWDSERQGLFIARDGLGIKPLYYSDNGTTLRLASQVKALQAGGAISRTIDPAAEAGFYLFGSIPEPLTLYQDIRALEAGHSLWVDPHGVGTPQCWFSLAALLGERAVATPTAAAHESALLDAVRAHLVADVPVGAFLSAGIDSGALVGLMRDAGQQQIRTITLAFEEFRGSNEDEAPLAAQVARHYATDHQTRYVARKEFTHDLPHILAAMDQPTIDGLNTWFVSKAAHEQGLKVAISGLGGDELLGGYPAFRDLPRWVGTLRLLPQPLGRLARRLGQGAITLGLPLNPKLAALAEYGGDYPGAWLVRRGLFMPWELPELMGEEAARHGLAQLDPLRHIAARIAPDPITPFARVAALESALYMRNQLLRDTDWASMAHSLEVRVPLVDIPLWRAIPEPLASKSLLARAPRNPLPAVIANRAKSGFRTPIDHWMADSELLRQRVSGHWSRRWAVAVMEGQRHG